MCLILRVNKVSSRLTNTVELKDYMKRVHVSVLCQNQGKLSLTKHNSILVVMQFVERTRHNVQKLCVAWWYIFEAKQMLYLGDHCLAHP